jgi:hypothetical protein
MGDTMPTSKTRFALAFAAASALLACDWYPGSTLSWSQTVRTWDPILGGNCMLVGSYEFRTDATMPPFDLKSSIAMRTENKDDQELLPQFVDVNYYLNASFLYQVPYELKKGKGKISLEAPFTWNFAEDDVLDVELCAAGGNIPIHTMVSQSMSLKFWKQF